MIRKNSRFMTVYKDFLSKENLDDYFKINEKDVVKFLLFMIKNGFYLDDKFFIKSMGLMNERILKDSNMEENGIKKLCEDIFNMYKNK